MIKNNSYFLSNTEDHTQMGYQLGLGSYIKAWLFSRFEKLLLIGVLLELLLGGNGYLVEIGGLRVRVLLYLMCMGLVLVKLLRKPEEKLPPLVTKFFFSFLAITIFGTVIGVLKGNSVGAMAGELKGILYFPMFLFFAVTIKKKADIQLISKLIITCGLIQAICYLFLLLTMNSGCISFFDVHQFLGKNSEFIFRHHSEQTTYVGFFYKGFFHLGVATLFLLFQPGQKKILYALLTITALALSVTRGVMLATILASFLGMFLIKDKRSIFTSLLVLFFCVVVQYKALKYEATLLYNASNNITESALIIEPDFFLNYLMRATDKIRILDAELVLKENDLNTILIGKGIGSPIGARQRIEVIFLEIFFKQGILGILFWLSLLVTSFFLFWKLKAEKKSEALPFVLSSLFVYLASATNNFLTGSIGMSIILICIVVIMVINKLNPESP